MAEAGTPPAAGRITLGVLGLLAGLASWLLLGVLPEGMAVAAPRTLLFLTGLGAAFFPAVLALAGPLSPGRALAAGALLALPLAGLLTWASFRFDTVTAYLATGHPRPAFALLVILSLPFLVTAFAPGARLGDYRVLFVQSWMIAVRFAAAWLFVGLVWGVLFLANALLGLVGIDLIARLIEHQAVSHLLTGLMLGLALAVVGEMSDYVSPDLVLQFLRLLLPLVLGVVAVFLAALPFRGLSNLFGTVSAAAVLLTMAFGAATLISTGLDASEDRRARGRLTFWCCRLMALLLPFLAILAGVSVWMRVAQYGLTPDRVVAAALVGLAAGYGLAYAGAVLAGPGWEDRIRRANVAMALVAIAVVAAFFTPLLDPQALSVRNQLARFQDGRTPADRLDLWAIGREWGRAGQAGLDRLAAMADHPEAARLAERLAALDRAPDRRAFERADEDVDAVRLAAELEPALPVRPEGAVLPAGFLGTLRPWELQQIHEACAHRTAGGNPGCVALVVDLSGSRPGDEVLIVAQNPGGAALVRAYFPDGTGTGFTMRSPEVLAGNDIYRGAGDAIDALITGDYRLAPIRLNALEVSGRTLFFGR